MARGKFPELPKALDAGIKCARESFYDQELWGKLVERAMARNFSWAAAAQRYEQLYRELAAQYEAAAA